MRGLDQAAAPSLWIRPRGSSQHRASVTGRRPWPARSLTKRSFAAGEGPSSGGLSSPLTKSRQSSSFSAHKSSMSRTQSKASPQPPFDTEKLEDAMLGRMGSLARARVRVRLGPGGWHAGAQVRHKTSMKPTSSSSVAGPRSGSSRCRALSRAPKARIWKMFRCVKHGIWLRAGHGRRPARLLHLLRTETLQGPRQSPMGTSPTTLP